MLRGSFIGLPIREMGNPSMHKMASNPGEYEIKFLRKNMLARSLRFTVGPDGQLASGLPLVYEFDEDNRPYAPGVIVPVAILDD